jgi:hypothetical protein
LTHKKGCVGANLWKLCNEINPISLDELTILNEGIMKKTKTKMFYDCFQTFLKTKRANLKVTQSGNLSMGH